MRLGLIGLYWYNEQGERRLLYYSDHQVFLLLLPNFGGWRISQSLPPPVISSVVSSYSASNYRTQGHFTPV